MSIYLEQSAIDEFDDEVKHAYQGAGKLRNTVTVRTNVVGSSYKFTRMGKGLANQKAIQADVTPMDVEHSRQVAILEDWNAPEYTDIFSHTEVNFDEKVYIAEAIARALTRREDQLIIDTLSGVTYSASPTNIDTGAQVAAGGTGLTVAKLRSAAEFLNDRGVDTDDRYIVHTAADLATLLGEDEVGSSDYNAIKALVHGEVNTFMGFNFCLIESRAEGGLPANKVYAYHKSAVGYAVGIDVKTEINYVPQKTSWLCNGMLKSGAVAREAAGMVEIQTA